MIGYDVHCMKRSFSICLALLLLVAPLLTDAAAYTYGTAAKFADYNPQVPGVAKIDSTHALIVNGIPSSNGVATVATISGSTITYGTSYQFSASYASRTDVAMLDSTHAVIVYTDGAGAPPAKVLIATLSGSMVTFGSPTIVSSNIRLSANAIKVAALDSTHFALVYGTFIEGDEFLMEPDEYDGYVVVGSVSGSSITLGSAQNFATTNTGELDIAALDATHFVFAYSGASSVRAATVSGTNITVGSAVSYGSGSPFLDRIDSTRFLINAVGSAENARVGTVSGTSITLGTALNYASTSAQFGSVAVTDVTHAVVAFTSTAYHLTINGSTLTASGSTTFMSGAGIQEAAGLTSGKVIFVAMSGSKGYAVVGLDTTAPGAVSNLSATIGGGSATLSWTNPADDDFSSVTIRRSTGGVPSGVTDGTAVASGQTGTSYADSGLSVGTYYYGLFAIDTAGNAAPVATVTVTIADESGGGGGVASFVLLMRQRNGLDALGHARTSSSSSSSAASDGSVLGTTDHPTATITSSAPSQVSSSARSLTAPVSSSKPPVSMTPFQDRTCARAIKWFASNASVLGRLNARLMRSFGFECRL